MADKNYQQVEQINAGQFLSHGFREFIRLFTDKAYSIDIDNEFRVGQILRKWLRTDDQVIRMLEAAKSGLQEFLEKQKVEETFRVKLEIELDLVKYFLDLAHILRETGVEHNVLVDKVEAIHNCVLSSMDRYRETVKSNVPGSKTGFSGPIQMVSIGFELLTDFLKHDFKLRQGHSPRKPNHGRSRGA